MWFKRGLRKLIADYTTRRDIYPWYMKNRKHKVNITATKYIEIVKKFNHLAMQSMIYENKEFVLPNRLGSLCILKRNYQIRLNKQGKVDTNRLVIDWKKTKEKWAKQYPDLTKEELLAIPNKKVIFNYNEHTDKQQYIFVWNKVTSNTPNQSAYYIEVVREPKTELAKALREIPTLKDNFYSLR